MDAISDFRTTSSGTRATPAESRPRRSAPRRSARRSRRWCRHRPRGPRPVCFRTNVDCSSPDRLSRHRQRFVESPSRHRASANHADFDSRPLHLGTPTASPRATAERHRRQRCSFCAKQQTRRLRLSLGDSFQWRPRAASIRGNRGKQRCEATRAEGTGATGVPHVSRDLPAS